VAFVVVGGQYGRVDEDSSAAFVFLRCQSGYGGAVKCNARVVLYCNIIARCSEEGRDSRVAKVSRPLQFCVDPLGLLLPLPQGSLLRHLVLWLLLLGPELPVLRVE
jgi:hypothetical protein